VVDLNEINLQFVQSEHFYQKQILGILPRTNINEGKEGKAIKDKGASEYIVIGNLLQVINYLNSLGILIFG
jgi:hypothetical protein